MIREVMEAMKPFRADTVLLIVANPVDLLTSLAKEMSGLPSSQVIGTGTALDTYRLRGMVASRALVSGRRDICTITFLTQNHYRYPHLLWMHSSWVAMEKTK